MTMVGAEEQPTFTYTRTAGFVTSILAIGSLVHSIFLSELIYFSVSSFKRALSGPHELNELTP